MLVDDAGVVEVDVLMDDLVLEREDLEVNIPLFIQSADKEASLA